MKTGRVLGAALAAGSAAAVLTLALHPMGGDPYRHADEIAARAGLAQAVHALGVAGQALLLVGLAGFSQRLGMGRASALAGLVFYALAAAAALTAMVFSGFVSGEAIGAFREADPADKGAARLLFFYGGWVTEAFTRIFVAASAAALTAWSLGLLASRRLTPLGWFGLAVGVAELAAVLAGMPVFNIHGLGLLVLAQAVWSFSLGIVLMRDPDWSAA